VSEIKKCLILSYGPVPTPEQDKVEGGGLRTWGLAKGLRSQNPDMEITVAYNESYRKSNHTTEFESIKVETWNLTTLGALMSDKDSIVVSYCMGDLSIGVVEAVRSDQQLILDCYVPIYVEISARASDDLRGEYDAFHNEVNRWSKVLQRGDVFLCANKNQKRFYQGVLAGLGRVNPATYSDNQILIVPYGIYSDSPVQTHKPITKKLGKQKNVNKVLWFGAVYPWFDLRLLIQAVNNLNKEGVPTKLVIVGAKNPFNGHPDFIKKYDELLEYIDQDKDAKVNTWLVDWVEFSDRGNWYLDSDVVISINKIGEENELAWRTRLMDYVWADLPVLTNAGDPLGDDLVSNGAAIKLEDISAKGLTASLRASLADKTELEKVRNNLKIVRGKYLWNEVTKPLYEAIESSQRPTDFIEFGLFDSIPDAQRSIIGKIVSKSKKIPHYYGKYGLRSTILASKTMLDRKVLGKFKPQRNKRVVFISHQLNNTGAPHVLIDLLDEFRREYSDLPIEFHTYNPTTPENIKKLNKLGVTPKVHISEDTRPGFVPGDVVVLNTVAFSDSVKDAVFSAVEQGIIKKLIWYVHEDEPEFIFTKSETIRIKRILATGKLKIFVLAEKTRANYVRHFGDDEHIIDQPYKLIMDKDMHIKRSSKDFDKLDFILPGMVGDGRKGQLPLVYAFIEFKKRYYDTNPEDYRDFTLTYVGMGDDFLSRQILKHVDKGLTDNFRYHKAVSREKSLELIAAANVTLCYSMRESLPLFVYEGMTAGHPLMRNDTSGLEEQLVDGENGYLLQSEDFESVVQSIEVILSRSKTTSGALRAMSDKSREIAAKAELGSFRSLTDAITEAF